MHFVDRGGYMVMSVLQVGRGEVCYVWVVAGLELMQFVAFRTTTVLSAGTSALRTERPWRSDMCHSVSQ